MAWLTPERRKAIYGIAGALAIALTVFGVVSTDDMLRILAAVTGVLAGLTNFMAFLKTNVDTGTQEFVDTGGESAVSADPSEDGDA